MAKPRKGAFRSRSVVRPKSGGARVNIPSGRSYGGGYRSANAAGGPASTPSNQWADVMDRMMAGMKTRMPGSGSSMMDPRRG